MINIRNIVYSIAVHVVILVVIFVLPSMNLMSKPKQDVITVQLLQGVPSGSLRPSMPPPVQDEVTDKTVESNPTVVEEEAKPIELEKPVEIKKPKPPVEKKADPKKKTTVTKKRSTNADKKTVTSKKVKELDAAALANADDSTGNESDDQIGSPFGTAKVDNPDFTYTWWMTQTFNKIQGNMRNTVQTDERLVCTIYFQILSSGRTAEVKVIHSSGVENFDQDCLDAIDRSAPFPPLPSEFKEEIIGITLPFINSY